MIDHVSLGVRDLERSALLYERALAAIGYAKLAVEPRTVGFGKKYPELWLNSRPALQAAADSGSHLCLRCRSKEQVVAFYRAATEAGARGDGAPGLRPEYHELYYAAFVRDFDEHLVEVVTFLPADR
jgi:catechol 2,3-dioxygenase-like lactoylglutathione lyase family enzyme